MSSSVTKVLDTALSDGQKMQNYVDTGHDQVIKTAMESKEYGSSSVLDLQESMKVLVRAEQKVKAVSGALKSLREQYESGELNDDEVDVVEVYQHYLNDEDAKYSEENVWQNPMMQNFISQLTGDDEEMKKILGDNSNQNDDSQDIQLTESHRMAKCPITQQEIMHPVKDKTCGHIFEKSAILAHLKHYKQRRKPAGCVFVGCRNVIRENNLEDVYVFRNNSSSTLMDI